MRWRLAGWGTALALFSMPVSGHAQEDGATLYQENCAACHGADRAGQGPFPTLIGVGDRLDEAEINAVIREGRGLMPPFAQLTDEQREALSAFLREG